LQIFSYSLFFVPFLSGTESPFNSPVILMVFRYMNAVMAEDNRFTAAVNIDPAVDTADNEDSDCDLFELDDIEKESTKASKRKPGVIYLPTIPPYMTVTKLREILGEFGDIGRVFLQPDDQTRKCVAVNCYSIWHGNGMFSREKEEGSCSSLL
jgi:RNA recognition motif-containing protein